MIFRVLSISRLRTIAGLVVGAFVLLLLTAQTTSARSSGIVNYSGNPQTIGGVNCSECHTGGDFGDPEFVRVLGRGTLLSGDTGNFSVDIDSSGNRNNCGVGISATAGQLVASDSDTRLAVNSLGDDEVVNDGAITSCGNIGFQWVAPTVTEPMTALFYVGGIRSDGSGQDDDTTGTAIYSVAVIPGVELRELFTFQSVVDGGQAGTDFLGDATRIVFSPDESALYVSGRDDDAIVAFDIDASSGGLTHFQTVQDNSEGGTADGLRSPTGLVITDDGTRIYAVSSSDDRIPVFTRAANGVLSFVSDEPAANRRDLTDIALSPDGQVLYVSAEDRSGGFQAGVALFTFDGGGLPVSLQTLNAGFGIPNSEFTSSPQALAVSPDSQFLYVSGFDPNGVFVLQRETGELTLSNPIQHQRSDVDGAHDVGAPRSMAMSPDGQYLYTTDRTADSLVVFERDAVTGLLTFLQALKRSDDTVDALQDPTDVQVSNSGRFVYVSGNAAEGSLAAFERDIASGFLSPVDAIFQSDAGFEALAGASRIAIDSSGTHLYVTGDVLFGSGTIMVVPEATALTSSGVALISLFGLLRMQRPKTPRPAGRISGIRRPPPQGHRPRAGNSERFREAARSGPRSGVSSSRATHPLAHRHNDESPHRHPLPQRPAMSQ
jgi:6-phosphogluconolactonase (cycloisomerase 2 family)